MVQAKHLANAPITEALIDIKGELSDEIDLGVLEGFHELVRENYPTKHSRFSGTVKIEFKGEDKTEIVDKTSQKDGFFFLSNDGKQIVQARLDGFTFNRLKPYEDWSIFSDEAKILWDRYVQVAKPSRITRLALRYINNIEIPLPIKDFKEYILTTPEIAPNLPQTLSNYFMRLVIPDQKTGAVAIITQAMKMQDSSKDVINLIFDIETYFGGSFLVDSDEIWGKFEILHNLKNEIFFETITEKTERLCK